MASCARCCWPCCCFKVNDPVQAPSAPPRVNDPVQAQSAPPRVQYSENVGSEVTMSFIGKFVEVVESTYKLKEPVNQDLAWGGVRTKDLLTDVLGHVFKGLEQVSWVGWAFKLYSVAKDSIDKADGSRETVAALTGRMDRLMTLLKRNAVGEGIDSVIDHLEGQILWTMSVVAGYALTWRTTRFLAADALEKLLESCRQSVNDAVADAAFGRVIGGPSFRHRQSLLQGARRLNGSVDDYVGLHSKVEEVTKMLKAPGGNTIGVFALNSMGGIGKTTLAAAICDDEWVRCNYDHVCWVEVTKDPTEEAIVDLQRDIYTQLTGHSTMDRQSGKSLLRKLMSEQKVFLVLDNIWDSKHSPVAVPPPSLSCVLLTTRDKNVARSLAGEERVYQLQTLTEEDSLQLLRKSAMLSKVKVDEKLGMVLKEVVRRCGQLPLAISVVGGLAVAEGESGDLRWWTHQLKRWKEQKSIGDVHTVLQQSFDAAPPQSRLAFLLVVAFLPNGGSSLLAYMATLLGIDEYEAYRSLKGINDRSLVSVEASKLHSLSLYDASKNDAMNGIFVHDLLRDVAMDLLERGRVGQQSFWLARDMWEERMTIDWAEHLVVKGRVTIDWAKMTRLRSLYVAYAEGVEFPAHALKLDSLASLVFSNFKLSSIPVELSALTNLTVLDLSKNHLSGIIPPALSALKNLSVLDLSNNQLSGHIPRAMSALQVLVFLDMSNNLISGPLPSELGLLHKLQVLKLQVFTTDFAFCMDCRLTLKGETLEGRVMSSNKVRVLCHNCFGKLDPISAEDFRPVAPKGSLSESIPPELFTLRSLQKFDVSGHQLSGRIPQELSLTNLTELYLSKNKLSGTIPPELCALTNLTILGLSANQLSGTIPPELSALTNLTILYLSANQLSGTIPPELSALTNLTELDLSANQLSGTIPPELSALTNL